ncbi:MAG TPA: hypothetical protein VFI73_05975 [Candidatus Nitrosopolaris sp.]|nr:hypothetical protein [Candidatus Nitrosopolaris sp.]
MRLLRTVIPVMLQNNSIISRNEKKKKGGVIINISSIPATAGYTEGSPYTG